MKYIIALLTLFVCFTAKAQEPKDSFYYAKLKQKGTKLVPVYNGKYKVFTQKVGKGKIKLLLLHGGPGGGHEYFENFPVHLKNQDITIYYFDQLGSYYSDNPMDSAAFTPSAFVEQVEEVRKALKLDNFYLLGHSWGGLLAELYAQKYQQHLKGLILSNVIGYDFSTSDKTKAFEDSLMNAWFDKTKALPAFSRHPRPVIDSAFDGQALADTALNKLLSRQIPKALDSMMYRLTYYNKNDALPEPLVRDSKHQRLVKRNPYLLHLQKTHKRLDYKTALQAITVKTLLLGSAEDYMYPQGYYDMQKAMTKATVRVEIVPNGSHYAMWDDTQNYFKAITQFIADVQARKF